MNKKLSFCLLFITFVPFSSFLAGEVATNTQPPIATNIWRYIEYSFPKAGEAWSGEPTFLLTSGEQWGQVSRGLRLDIMNIVQGFQFFKTNAISTRLHRATGQIVEPTAEGKKMLKAPVAASSASLPGEEPAPQVITYFPWGTDVLEEAWIEVTIGSERYWLEIPYGFDQNPIDPVPPSTRGGPPEFIPAMDRLTEHDHVIRWQDIHCELGRTQDSRELSLIQSNPFDAKSEIELYRFPKSQDLCSPHTDVRILDADGTVVTGRCVNLHLDDNHLRRTDTFDLFDRGANNLRCWGQIEISVDDKIYRVPVPSSLYKYVHGHARQPLATDFLSALRIGMTLKEVDRISRNYITDGIRSRAVSSASVHEYRLAIQRDSSEATIKFDESDRLVSWK